MKTCSQCTCLLLFFFFLVNTTRTEILIADSVYYFIQIEQAVKNEHIHTHAKLRALMGAMRSTRLLVYSHTRRRRLNQTRASEQNIMPCSQGKPSGTQHGGLLLCYV